MQEIQRAANTIADERQLEVELRLLSADRAAATSE